MYENVKMENMTWQEFAKKKDDVIILPIGATEQHGPHLPTCVDSVLAREFAYRVAEKINGVVAPTISYGYKSKPLSGGGPLFPGTIDLNGATLQALVMDILDEFVRDGFTKIFILSAHFENEAFIVENASPATYFRYPIEKDIVPETGILASAKSSSAARGKIIVDDVVPNIIKIVEEAFK